MLSLKEAIQSRRSIRSFRPDPVPEEMIQEILEAARLAPSGANRQPWRFMVVKDRETRQKIRRICLDQKFLEEAPVVIIAFVDLKAYSKQEAAKRRQEFDVFGVSETLSGRFADPAFRAMRDSAPEPSRAQMISSGLANTYIAAEHLVLTATALGLGTCWVGARGEPGQLEALLQTPENLVPVVVIPVGFPAKVPPARPRLPLSEILVPPPQPSGRGD